MNISPRKSEIEAVMRLVDDTPYTGDAERTALGKAIVKAVYASFLDREWWVFAARYGSEGTLRTTVPFGPFTSESEARRFYEKVRPSSSSAVLAKLYPPNPSMRLAEQYPAAETPETPETAGQP